MSEFIKRYAEASRTGEVVFDGKPLKYFEGMSALNLYEYKKMHPEFEDSWVFKAILHNHGPAFYLLATTGDDLPRSHTEKKKEEDNFRISRW